MARVVLAVVVGAATLVVVGAEALVVVAAGAATLVVVGAAGAAAPAPFQSFGPGMG